MSQFDLTESQIAFVETARSFARERLAPFAADWDESGQFPLDVIREAGQFGFLSLYTPESAGGLGLSRLDSSLIIEQLAAGCTSTTAFMTIHNMALWMLATFGNETVQSTFVPKLLTGEHLASYCLTESGSGSDAASMKTKAVKTANEYVLSGSKAFISGAGETDVLVVMAKCVESPTDEKSGIASFAVPAHAEGVSYGENEKKMGWRNQPTKEIYFNEVRLPEDFRLGGPSDGFKIAMQGLDGGRINIASCSNGTAQAALDRAVAYLRERQQFGKPLAEFQGLQFRIADCLTELIAAKQMVRLAASRLDQKHPEATAFCAMAKRFATDVGFRICNEALQLHGGYGYLQSLPLERHVRDTRVHQILEGTNEIMRVIIARRLLLADTLEAFA